MKLECVALAQGKLGSKGLAGKLVELVKKAGQDCEADMTHKHQDLVNELKTVSRVTRVPRDNSRPYGGVRGVGRVYSPGTVPGGMYPAHCIRP